MKQSKTSNHIPQDLINEIREKSDIVQVISDYGIALQPAGKEYRANCPFHEENDPSFYVSPENQMFYCFGCHAGGTVFTFLQKYEGLSFIDAVKEIAEQVGVRLPGSSSKSRRHINRTAIKELNEFALEFFHRKLQDSRTGKRASDYLKRRGVHNRTVAEMNLGYAPSGNQLLKDAIKRGFSIKLLKEGGLVKERYGRETDQFRNRLIFPIFDERGSPVGFAGRALDDTIPKYLNSPETLLYKKSQILYNLNLAKTEIQKTKEAILVEGYMDAIIPYQAGITNIVASSGTSLSDRHAKLLKRWAETVIIVYDGDPAGIRAAIRGMDILVKEGLRVKVAVLPQDTDPDDFVRKNGVDKFRGLIDKAENIVEFQIRMAAREEDITEVNTKVRIVKELASTLSNVQNNIELSEYIDRISEELKIDREVLISELRKHGVSFKHSSRVRYGKSNSYKDSEKYVEWHLIKILLLRPDLIGEVKSHLNYEDFTNKYASKIFQMLCAEYGKRAEVNISELIDNCTDEEIRGIMSNLIFDVDRAKTYRCSIFGGLGGSRLSHLTEKVKEDRIKGSVIQMIDQMLKNLEKQLRSSAELADEKALEKLILLGKRRKKLKHRVGKGVIK